MNFRLLSHTMGYILWVEAGFLLLPALTACIYAETCWQQFLLTALLCAAAGTVLHLIPVKKAQMHSRDGFVAVALSWVLLSLFGALPYVFTGAMTSYIDALFETVSGLTTTGSSTFTAVSHLPRSVLLWRSLTQWMGGMGVLVLFLALTPKLGEGAVFLMRAESPGAQGGRHRQDTLSDLCGADPLRGAGPASGGRELVLRRLPQLYHHGHRRLLDL